MTVGIQGLRIRPNPPGTHLPEVQRHRSKAGSRDGQEHGDSVTEIERFTCKRIGHAGISSYNALESAIVIEAKKGEAGGRELDLLLHRARIDIIPFTADQVELARTAWRQFGKGQHPAGLNIGDCCAYALAKFSGEPLLFKGNDFNQTDVRSVTET